MSDVLIIGGGVIGLSIARELAAASLKVTLLDRQRPGQEASWAGAGILPPTVPGPAEHLLAMLTRASHALWSSLSEELQEATGIDNGYRECGGIQLPPSCSQTPAITLSTTDQSSSEEEMNDWRIAGADVEPIQSGECRLYEPNLAVTDARAFRLPEVCQVRNPRHIKALIQRCEQLGVQFLTGQSAEEITIHDGRVKSVFTPQGHFSADHYVLAAGAWSGSLLSRLGIQLNVTPIRGQILQLKLEQPPIKHVIECGPRYLVPRDDGLVLVGATEESVGFQKGNTDAGLNGLLDFALEIVPTLQAAHVVDAWSGLRPHRPGGLPIMSRVDGIEHLYVAAGHFRSGLHLSPITGRLIKQQILGEKTDLPMDAFRLTSSH